MYIGLEKPRSSETEGFPWFVISTLGGPPVSRQLSGIYRLSFGGSHYELIVMKDNVRLKYAVLRNKLCEWVRGADSKVPAPRAINPTDKSFSYALSLVGSGSKLTTHVVQPE